MVGVVAATNEGVERANGNSLVSLKGAGFVGDTISLTLLSILADFGDGGGIVVTGGGGGVLNDIKGNKLCDAKHIAWCSVRAAKES